jgi:hypothetical protein
MELRRFKSSRRKLSNKLFVGAPRLAAVPAEVHPVATDRVTRSFDLIERESGDQSPQSKGCAGWADFLDFNDRAGR